MAVSVGHVQKREVNNVTRRVMDLTVPGTRQRGRPKKTWHQQIKDDMTGVGVTQDIAQDRKEWIRRTFLCRPRDIGKMPSR